MLVPSMSPAQGCHGNTDTVTELLCVDETLRAASQTYERQRLATCVSPLATISNPTSWLTCGLMCVVRSV